MRSIPQRIAAGIAATCLTVVASAACSTGMRAAPDAGIQPIGIPTAPGTGVQAIGSSAAVKSAAAAPLPHVAADVDFMTGMISHHAQAVLMAGWAPSHGAGAAVRRLCERIVVGQRDEIRLMQHWLRDVGEPVPDGQPMYMKTPMAGMEHPMLMPGMLTAEELARLDEARGAEFDRLFLTGMIRHHQGAITMVDELFNSYGAAQDERIFRFASNVYADQTTEIARMQRMLTALTSDDASRDEPPSSPRS